MTEKQNEATSYRLEAIAFGLADGLIMCLGLIIGVAEATLNAKFVIISGVIGGFANAFGNSIGFFMSQSAERGLQIHETIEHGVPTRIHSKKEVVVNSTFSFASTIAASIILITPFIFFSIDTAPILSFIIGIIMAFILGVNVGIISRENPYQSGLKYAILAVVGTVIAHIIGDLVQLV